ncbi:MAG: hypothetical protein NT099_07245 [Candidatus Saganbacteria bacterium]|nr:hypothetical protein [Candidatus Saganbacteria bacterium]
MKKILIVLFASLFLVSFFAIGSFAATAVAEKSGQLGFGVSSGVNNGIPSVRYYFNETMAGELGFSLTNASSTTQLQIGASLTNDFVTDQKVKAHWGGTLAYTSNVVAASTNSITLAGILGVEAFILPKFSLTVDIIPLSYTMVNANGNQTNILQIGSATSTIISSFHYYL